MAHAEDRGLAVAMLATHAWAERTEDEAVAFGLDGGDRTYQLAALQTLSPALQGSILAVGALHVLPSRPTWVTRPGNVGSTARLSSSRIHEHVAKQCGGCCRLECTSESCEGVPGGGEVPTTVSAFEAALECERCGSDTALCWWTDAPADARPLPLAVGAAAALGPSFAESYAVWYTMRGRATIGNAAYEAGAAMTRTKPMAAERLTVGAAGGARCVALRPSGGAAASAVGAAGGARGAAARPSGGAAASALGVAGGARGAAARPSGGGAATAVGVAGGGRGGAAGSSTAAAAGGARGGVALPSGSGTATAVGAAGGKCRIAARPSSGGAAIVVGATGRGASVAAQARCRGSAAAGVDAFQTPPVSRESSGGERSDFDNGYDGGVAGSNEYVEAASLPVWSPIVGVLCMRAVCVHVVQALHHRLPEARWTA